MCIQFLLRRDLHMLHQCGLREWFCVRCGYLLRQYSGLPADMHPSGKLGEACRLKIEENGPPDKFSPMTVDCDVSICRLNEWDIWKWKLFH